MYMGEGSAQNLGSHNGGPWRTIFTVAASPAYLTQVDTIDRSIYFQPGLQNLPERIVHSSGVTETYGYTRNNVSTVTEGGVLTKRAIYPPASACDANPRTCNQPTSTFDANNKETVYEYHPESGQVSRVFPPADQSGKRAEVRYDYQAFRARYFDNTGARVEGTPVWLKVAERRCHDSNYASSSAGAGCVGGDEVITRYEYNSNNLLLTNTATTGAGGKTLRTCFQYDVYGNKIGETEPKGAANCR
jgi:hypothetical protein